jgi:protein-disulfide isomerase
VRRSLLLTLVLCCAAPLFSAPPPLSERLAAFFRGWYAHIPGSEVVVTPTRDVVLPGLETYRVERRSGSKAYQESNVVLYDAATREIFVGDAFQDPGRAGGRRMFEAGSDLPNMETALREAFGLPVKVELGTPARGALKPLKVLVSQEKDGDAFASRAGFVSNDGSTLMLGEFHPLSENPTAFREKLLGQSAGVRGEPGSPTRQSLRQSGYGSPAKAESRDGDGARFTVTEFLDFQCERCRVRTPDVRRAVAEKGGTVEIRFLPLVKVHDWGFAAAESAAALAGVGPELYHRYEESVFGRAEGMTAAAARELAVDIADAAGAREAYNAELASGRARGRVLRDISLAQRLGVMATPSFLFRGTLLPGEKGLLEDYLFASLPAAVRRTATPAP